MFGHPGAIGEDFHITSEESLTWNQIYQLVGRAAGAEPMILHVPSDAIVASDPEQEGNLWGDKSHSTVFGNNKLRSLVPDFKATVPFSAGIRETVAWFDADPRRQEIDHEANERWDRLARDLRGGAQVARPSRPAARPRRPTAGRRGQRPGSAQLPAPSRRLRSCGS